VSVKCGALTVLYLLYVLLGPQALIEQDTPFGKVARPFFNGNDDEFRNNRFKLIPKVNLLFQTIFGPLL
jgi:hypothetical protein